MQCPILGNFGELDDNPTPDEVREIEAELQKYGKTCDFKIYPGVGARFCSDHPDSYHEESAKNALARTMDWLQKYLVPVTVTA